MTAYVKTIGLRGPVAIPEPENIPEFNEDGDLDLGTRKLIMSDGTSSYEITINGTGDGLTVTEIV